MARPCLGGRAQVEPVEADAAELEVAGDLDLVLHIDGAEIEIVGVVGAVGVLRNVTGA